MITTLTALLCLAPQGPTQGNLVDVSQSLWITPATEAGRYSWNVRGAGQMKRTGPMTDAPPNHGNFHYGPNLQMAPFAAPGIEVAALAVNNNWIAMDKANGLATALVLGEGWAGVSIGFEEIPKTEPDMHLPRITAERVGPGYTGNGIGADSFQFNFDDSVGIPQEIKGVLLKYSDNQDLKLLNHAAHGLPEVVAHDLLLPSAVGNPSILPIAQDFNGIVFALEDPTLPPMWGVDPNFWRGSTLFKVDWSPTGGWGQASVFRTALDLGIDAEEQIQAVSWDRANNIIAFVKSSLASEIHWHDTAAPQPAGSTELRTAWGSQGSLTGSIGINLGGISIDSLCFYDPRIPSYGNYTAQPASSASGQIHWSLSRLVEPSPPSVAQNDDVLRVCLGVPNPASYTSGATVSVLNVHTSMTTPPIGFVTNAINTTATSLVQTIDLGSVTPQGGLTFYFQTGIVDFATGSIEISDWRKMTL